MGHVCFHIKTKMSYVSSHGKFYVEAQANFFIYNLCTKSSLFIQNIIEIVKLYQSNTHIYE